MFTVFFGFAYAFAGTGVAQAALQGQADGSITANGSTLIGQNWSQTPCPGHPLGSCVFQGRPDDLGPYAGSSKPGRRRRGQPARGQQHPRQARGLELRRVRRDEPRAALRDAAAEHAAAGRLLEGSGRQPDARPGHDLGQRVRPRHHPAGRLRRDPHGVPGDRDLPFVAAKPDQPEHEGRQLGFLGSPYVERAAAQRGAGQAQGVRDHRAIAALGPTTAGDLRRRGRLRGRVECALGADRRRSWATAPGPLVLRFLGRAAVPGIEPGRRLVAEGTPGLGAAASS